MRDGRSARIEYSDHLDEMLAVRELDPDWVAQTLEHPEHTEADPKPGRWRSFRRILAEFDSEKPGATNSQPK